MATANKAVKAAKAELTPADVTKLLNDYLAMEATKDRKRGALLTKLRKLPQDVLFSAYIRMSSTQENHMNRLSIFGHN